MFAWWGRMVVRLRWLVLAILAAIFVLGATWGGGVFGDLISGGFDDPSSPSSRAHSEITERLGRQDVDVIALYSNPAPAGGIVLRAEPTTDPGAATAVQRGAAEVAVALKARPEVTSVMPGPASSNGEATYLAIQLRDGDEDWKWRSVG